MLDFRNPNSALYLLQQNDEKYATRKEVARLAEEVEALEERVDDFKPGGTSFTTDETLRLENGVLGVNTANSVADNNSLPITAAAVYTTVGNIEVFLRTI